MLRFLLLFLTTHLLTANEHYLLPENRSDLLHSLQQKILRAQEITIVTSELQSSMLKRGIEKAITKGVHFSLLTQNTESAGTFAKYKNSSIYLMPQSDRVHHLELMLLLIDKSDLCYGSIALNEKSMREVISLITCTTNREEIAFAQRSIASYKKWFEPYND